MVRSRKSPSLDATTTGWMYFNPGACEALKIREGDYIAIDDNDWTIRKVSEFNPLAIQVSRHGAIQRPGCRISCKEATNELFKRVSGKPIKKGYSIKIPLKCETNFVTLII